MRIVALLTVRNEEVYLERCLEHLFSQGIETCFIDNDSTDKSREIAERFLKRGVFRLERQPYLGYFDLVGQLSLKEKLADDIDADWFIHCDADEVMEAPSPFASLHAGIESADAAGFEVTNFDEFVFVPTANTESYEGTDYVEKMQYYYFFEPWTNWLNRAWKKTARKIDLATVAGHHLNIPAEKIYPQNFILRHYIFLSASHAIRKYGHERIYSRDEVERRGWHGSRARFRAERLRLPGRGRLRCLTPHGTWDRSDPWKVHTFFGEE